MRATVAAVIAGGMLVSAVSITRADPKSDELFAKAKAVAAKTKALDSELSVSMGSGEAAQKLSGSIKVLKPNSWDLSFSSADGNMNQRLVTDGKTAFQVMDSQKQYMKMDAPPSGMFAQMGLPAAALLLEPQSLPSTKGARYLGKVSGSGQQYDVVSLPPLAGMPKGSTVKVYFGSSGLPEGQETTMKEGGQTISQKVWLRKPNLNPELTEKQFAYTPPADFKLFERPDLNGSLLAVDKEAPDFLLPQPGGGTQLSLSQARKGKKAVLVNFWFYG